MPPRPAGPGRGRERASAGDRGPQESFARRVAQFVLAFSLGDQDLARKHQRLLREVQGPVMAQSNRHLRFRTHPRPFHSEKQYVSFVLFCAAMDGVRDRDYEYLQTSSAFRRRLEEREALRRAAGNAIRLCELAHRRMASRLSRASRDAGAGRVIGQGAGQGAAGGPAEGPNGRDLYPALRSVYRGWDLAGRILEFAQASGVDVSVSDGDIRISVHPGEGEGDLVGVTGEGLNGARPAPPANAAASAAANASLPAPAGVPPLIPHLAPSLLPPMGGAMAGTMAAAAGPPLIPPLMPPLAPQLAPQLTPQLTPPLPLFHPAGPEPYPFLALPPAHSPDAEALPAPHPAFDFLPPPHSVRLQDYPLVPLPQEIQQGSFAPLFPIPAPDLAESTPAASPYMPGQSDWTFFRKPEGPELLSRCGDLEAPSGSIPGAGVDNPTELVNKDGSEPSGDAPAASNAGNAERALQTPQSSPLGAFPVQLLPLPSLLPASASGSPESRTSRSRVETPSHGAQPAQPNLTLDATAPFPPPR